MTFFKNRNILHIVCVLLLISACSSEEELDSGEWLIPQSEVKDGGPGKDGIPALLNPEFIDIGAADYLDDDDLVIGYRLGNDTRAYPHKILDWHEIANDEVNGVAKAITYCPLTGTAIGWEREYNGETTTFGVSGLLYNTNLMPYDRLTNSTWSQLGLQSVNGSLIGTEAQTFQVFETTWETWKSLFPDSKVMSTNTGHSRNYSRYPYGDYRTSPGLIFSVSLDDSRLPQKERVHGIIIDNQVKAYQFQNFTGGKVIKDNFQNQDIVVIGHEGSNYIISFYQKIIDGTTLEFQIIENPSNGLILEDQFENKWNPFGQAIEGPNQGEQLNMTNSVIGMWFSWAPFYGQPALYEE